MSTYKKRVIQVASSDEEEEEIQQPQVKKSKPDSTSTPILPNPSGPPSTTESSTKVPSVPVIAKVEPATAILNVFTTGGSSASEDGSDGNDSEEEEKKKEKKKTKEVKKPVSKSTTAVKPVSTNSNGNGTIKNVKSNVGKGGKRSKESIDSDSEEEPLSKKIVAVAPVSKKSKVATAETAPKPTSTSTANKKKPISPSSDHEESSEDEKPVVKSKSNSKSNSSKKSVPAPALVVASKSKNARASTSSSTKRKNTKSSDASELEEEEASASSKEEDSSDDSEDVPLAKSVAKSKPQSKPTTTTTTTKAKPAQKTKGGAVVKSESESPVKKTKGTPSAAAGKENGKLNGKGKGRKSENGGDDEDVKSEDGDEIHRWWDEDDNGDIKWKTLEHNGIIFPPEYEPHGIQMKYDGKPVLLPPEAEEVATFFAAILETEHYKNPVFVKNFFSSFQEILKEHPPLDGTKITTITKCDFNPIYNYLDEEKIKKKLMTTAEKKMIKTARDILEEPYKHCLLDGRKEKVGNFRVEPPGLFRGRGEHPKTGLLKTRVQAEQITINIGEGAKVPPPPKGHKWKDVVHDDKVTWLATWKENINGAVKYVFLAAGSSLKGQSDFKKFEKARALKEHIDRIRKDYTADLKNKEMLVRQRATAIYFIDRFALRNGNEKGEDEADTVGCCSLRFEHVTLTPPTTVTFDFLGKDSIRYINEVQVDEQVFKNLKIFKKEPKKVGDLLFDRLQTSMVNKYLTGYMDGLTAKVFRTYNASWTFVQQLRDTPKDASVADKILAYNRANRLVAVLCNHQKSVSKGHGVLMDKMADKLLALKYQRKKLRCALLATAGKSKKYKAYEEDESDLEDDWITKHEIELVVLEKDKIRKKFEKDNKKLEETNEPVMKDIVLKERLEVADTLEATLKEEKKKGWKVSKLSEDKILAAIIKMDEKILIQKAAALDRDEGKEVSLGTSKINYLDPRITVHWALKHDVPLTKLLSKTLLEKFVWAVEGIKSDPDFEW